MVTSRTVLVVGAGGSQGYGFPLGRKLYENIMDRLNTHGEFKEELVKIGYRAKDIEDFGKAMMYAQFASIDTFLEARQEFKEIGKICIARELAPLESEGQVFLRGGHWYSYLTDYLESSGEPFSGNNLTVITFNYDRSLEHYLTKVAANRRNMDEKDVFTSLEKNLPIIHVYGSLGMLFPHGPGFSRDYKPAQDIDTMKKCADCILTIDELRDLKSPGSEITRARKALRDADRVFIVGFGYHADNIVFLALRTGNLSTVKLLLARGAKRQVGDWDLAVTAREVLEDLDRNGYDPKPSAAPILNGLANNTYQVKRTN